MRGILAVVRHDLSHVGSSVIGIIMVIGLAMLPSLFTWFNVLASWNPFANTKNLTVAVANTDRGYQSDLLPLRVNIGDQVAAMLHADKDLNWQITSEQDAVNGTKSGRYYAAIIVPPQFSRDMMTFYTDQGEHAKFAYYTNEEKNALAPKITGQSADDMSARINSSFTRTVSEAGLNIVSSLSNYMQRPETRAGLQRIGSRMELSERQLRNASDTTAMFTSLIGSSQSLIRSSAQLAGEGAQTQQDAQSALAGAAGSAKRIQSSLDSATAGVASAIDATARSYDAAKASIDTVFNGMDTQSGEQVKAIQSISRQVQGQIDGLNRLRGGLEGLQHQGLDTQPALDSLQHSIDQLTRLRDGLQNAAGTVGSTNSQVQGTHREINGLIDQAKQSVQDFRNAYDTNLRADLNALSQNVASTASTLASAGDQLRGVTSGLSSGPGSLTAQLDSAGALTRAVSASLADAANRIGALRASLAKALQGGDLAELKQMIGSDPNALAADLAAPVGLTRVAVFPVANFGTAMTPFYAVLGLWVGALLMAVSIRTDVPQNILPGGGRLSASQQYLGRYGTILVIGFLQSTLLCLGAMLFVGVRPVSPLLLMLAGWTTGLVFTMTVYTLVASFGSAGKALSVLLLVIQISGSGGAYPLQMLPKWFQDIGPYLPATHAVDAFRSAIAGLYQNDYWVSLGKLLLFLLPVLLLGLVLRKPLISLNEKIESAVTSTKVIR